MIRAISRVLARQRDRLGRWKARVKRSGLPAGFVFVVTARTRKLQCAEVDVTCVGCGAAVRDTGRQHLRQLRRYPCGVLDSKRALRGSRPTRRTASANLRPVKHRRELQSFPKVRRCDRVAGSSYLQNQLDYG